MRRAAKVDDNQAAIVSALRLMGCSVQHLHGVGEGTPDLLVGFCAKNLLIEVKDGAKPTSKQKLTPQQVVWHQSWRGQVAVVRSENEAIEAVIEATKEKGRD